MAVETKAPATVLPMTGAEYLESLRDGREIWIYGERVEGRHHAPGLPQPRPHAGPALRRPARPGAARRADLPDRHRLRRLHPPLLPGAAQRRGAGGRRATRSPRGRA